MARRLFGLRWRRRHLQRAAVVLAAMLVVAAIALFVNLYKSSSPNGSGGPGGSDGAAGLGAGSGLPGSSVTTGSGDTSMLKNFPSELTRQLGRKFTGNHGHTVVLTVPSSATVARLGYLVPSADRDQFGDHRNVVHGWTQTFVARGPYGPYSAIFIQTDRAGTPVHCTVTVDGVEKDSQTITGEYGRGLCYG
jgi:hypothetical protein